MSTHDRRQTRATGRQSIRSQPVKRPPERLHPGLPSRDELLRRVERLCVAICHDLRAPVATAGAAIQSLVPGHGGEHDRLLEIARHGIAQAAELLGALPRLVERAEAGPVAPVDLEALIDDLREDLRFDLRLVGGVLRRRGSLPTVLADRERLRLALRGLLRNSVRHRREDVPLEIVARAFRRGGRATLTLTDNGCGFPPGERASLFSPLLRGPGAVDRDGAHPLERGLGLGLAIARREILAMGGRLSADSRPGAGASFAITLRSAPATASDP